MVYKYEWGGYQFPVPAETVGKRCEQIEQAYGNVTKQNLVDDARPEDSELHSLFEWDDAVAGEAYRRFQAGKVLSSLKLTVVKRDSTPVRVKAFVNVSSESSARYVNINVARADSSKMSVVLRNAFNEMQMFIAKYRGLSELECVIDAMETAMEKVRNEQREAG